MPFDDSHYVPILKGKKGELNALRALHQSNAEITGKYTPLVEVPRISIDYQPNQTPKKKKSIAKHIDDTAKAFALNLSGLPIIIVDTCYLEEEPRLSDGTSPSAAMFAALSTVAVQFIPTIGIDSTGAIADAVKEAGKRDKRGYCLRILETDFEAVGGIAAQIESLLAGLGVEPKSIDLLLDFKDGVPSKAALPFLVDALPHLTEWRTLTLASSSFPRQLTGKNKITELERKEWEAWVFLRNRQRADNKRVPTFGDYAVNHPVFDEDFNPMLITMSPNIRYTDSLSYVIARGEPQPRKKTAKTADQKAKREALAHKFQYHKLATMIKGHPSWKNNPAFSPGDKFIDKCSHKSPGNSTDWRSVGTSHHIVLTVQQISNLP